MSCWECFRQIFAKKREYNIKDISHDSANDEFAIYDRFVGYCKLRLAEENSSLQDCSATIGEDAVK